MHVKSRDGKDLGKVSSCNEETFYVEKGFLFSREYVGSYQEIAEVKDDDIILNSTYEQLKASWNADQPELDGSQAGAAEAPIAGAGAQGFAGNSATGAEVHDSPQYGGSMGYRTPSGERRETYPESHDSAPEAGDEAEGSQEYRIPLYEEELDAVKTTQRKDLHLKKNVITEEQTIKVPVRHEEVVIERTTAHDPTQEGDETTFEEGEYRVPLYEDEVELYKTPVKTGEVRITKSVIEDEEEFSAPVKKEELDFEEEHGRRKSERRSEARDPEHRPEL